MKIQNESLTAKATSSKVTRPSSTMLPMGLSQQNKVSIAAKAFLTRTVMNSKQKLYSYIRQIPRSPKTIIFAHMPKAAGISLNTILKKQYGTAQVLELDPKNPPKAFDDVKNMPLGKILQLRALSAHVIWGIHEWLPCPFIYLTVLRHPVERVLSTYSYILHSQTHRLHTEMLDRHMKLEEFLEWDRSAEEVNNLQCRLLSGLFFEKEHPISMLYSKARANLAQYSLVGLTEQFAESLQQFSMLFGWKNVQIEYDNVTPNRIKRAEIDPQTLRRIEQMNQYDLELYAFAQQLFAEQCQDIYAVFAKKTTK